MDNEEKVLAVQKMQDYISQNINKPITLNGLASAANYSRWHSAKIFKECLGKTPFEYIREVRLTEAAKKLRDEKAKVIDVAFNFFFESHEGFTRAFTKQFGISPFCYKNNPLPVRYFIPQKFISYDLTVKKRGVKMEGKKTSFVFTQVVERPQRKALIKRGVKAEDYYEYCNEVGCDIEGILQSVKEALFEPAGFWLPSKLIEPGTSKYVQGVEVGVDYNSKIPEGFDIIDLEPCKMLVFQGEPFKDEDYEQAIGDIWEAIKKFCPETYGYKWAYEQAPRFQLVPLGHRGYIEAHPIIEIK